jgi:mitochondrial fission protein ELM1
MVVHLDYLSNRVYDKAVQFILPFNDHDHPRLTITAGRQVKPPAKVDCGHDPTAQVQAAGNFRRR